MHSVSLKFLVGILSFSDYYPFGMQMPGRNASTGDYRYGYQGSEKDGEISGEGNSYSTFFRQLDVRLGRWKSIDPKATAWESPYVSMGNNPILYNDVLGDTLGLEGDGVDDFVKTVNEGLGGFYDAEMKDGIMHLASTDKEGEMTQAQQEFYNGINSAASFDVGMVSIDIDKSSVVVVGSFYTQTIDIDDVKQFGLTGPMSQFSLLGHEVSEQAKKQLDGQDFDAAHWDALGVEGEISGYSRGAPLPSSKERLISTVTYKDIEFRVTSGTMDYKLSEVGGNGTAFVRLHMTENNVTNVSTYKLTGNLMRDMKILEMFK
jgi:RHS repeat-associated protein